MAVTTVEGVEDVLRGFSRLSKSVQRQYLGASVREVVKDAVPDVKALTPRGPTGNLRRSVGLKLEKKRTTTAVGIVGYRRGKGNNRELGFHAAWVEEGVNDRYPQGKALKLPLRYSRKYPYLSGLVSRIGGNEDGGIYLQSVRGYRGTGKFRQWADANMPRLKQELVGKLENNLGKAIADEERRMIRQLRRT